MAKFVCAFKCIIDNWISLGRFREFSTPFNDCVCWWWDGMGGGGGAGE